MREISGTITNMMALQCSPKKGQKCMGPAQKSHFYQLWLEQAQKHLSLTDML